MIRIGYGYDVHRFVKGRKLKLGGVEIPFEQGLLGHSDADVVIHSVIDAILGALALGDIGKLFPDNDDKYKNIDSTILLKKVYDLMYEKNYRVSNLDITIIADKPKLSSYILQIKKKLANLLNTDYENISVKATTEEGLALKGEGIGCVSVLLLTK